jgi:hypothetical protein
MEPQCAFQNLISLSEIICVKCACAKTTGKDRSDIGHDVCKLNAPMPLFASARQNSTSMVRMRMRDLIAIGSRPAAKSARFLLRLGGWWQRTGRFQDPMNETRHPSVPSRTRYLVNRIKREDLVIFLVLERSSGDAPETAPVSRRKRVQHYLSEPLHEQCFRLCHRVRHDGVDVPSTRQSDCIEREPALACANSLSCDPSATGSVRAGEAAILASGIGRRAVRKFSSHFRPQGQCRGHKSAFGCFTFLS